MKDVLDASFKVASAFLSSGTGGFHMIEPRKQLSANKWNQFLADAEVRWHLPAAALVDVTDPHQLATKSANEFDTSKARMEREVPDLLADFIAKLRRAA